MEDQYDRSDGYVGKESAWRDERGAAHESLTGVSPILPALLVVAGLWPVSWLVSSTTGYALAGGFICLLLVYGLAVDGPPTYLSPVAILLTAYWLLLLLQFFFTWELSFVPYILLTPLAILAVMIVAPRLIEYDRHRYAAALTWIVTVLTAIGVLLLAITHLFDVWFPHTARGVLGWYPYRIASVFTNSNYFGLVAAIGTLSALYLALERRQQLWTALVVVLAIATVLSNNRTALLAGFLAVIVLVRQSDVRILERISTAVLTGIAFGTVLVLSQIVQPVYFELAWVSLVGRLEAWEVALLEAAANPFIGSGFEADFVVHNSYLNVLLHAGFVAGWFYILAVVWAIIRGWSRTLSVSGTLWDAYVFATLLFLAIYMVFESTTIGGLSVSSLLVALYVGLAAKPTGGPFDVAIQDLVTAADAGRERINRQLGD